MNCCVSHFYVPLASRPRFLPLYRLQFYYVIPIYESADLLGFWFETEAYGKNNHRHIVNIPRIIFSHNEDIEQKDSKSTGSFIIP
jgi:hypothetical protein